MAVNGNKRTRLTIDVTAELRRRIKVAAAERGVSIREYVVGILDRAVDGGEGGRERPRGRPITKETIERFDQIRNEIMRGRVFTDSSADLIEEARMERTAEP